MSRYPGKFIVIDGSDGSGKTTQLQILASHLRQEGFDVELADFPQYNTKSAGMVEEYLSGKYGGADEVNPYAASLLYAVDRFDASFQIREWLKEGKVVISNRYISSNFAHQGNKIENALERKLFFNWLSEIEYNIFNIPKPDLYLILYVDPEISQGLAKARHREDWKGKTQDIHEDNLNHLKKAAATYLEIARDLPGFKLIRCSHQGKIMSREDIHYLVWRQVDGLLQNNGRYNNGPEALGEILAKNEKLEVKTPTITPKINQQEEIEEKLEEKEISDNPQRIIVERIRDEAKIPSRHHTSDAGLDLYAAEDCSIPPYGQYLVPTGIKIALPKGYAGLIWDKSGLANQGFTTLGGVIDPSYRGEIKVVFKNLSEDIYHIRSGQKIAQLLIQKVETPIPQEGEVDEGEERQDKGFGSSGLF